MLNQQDAVTVDTIHGKAEITFLEKGLNDDTMQMFGVEPEGPIYYATIEGGAMGKGKTQSEAIADLIANRRGQ